MIATVARKEAGAIETDVVTAFVHHLRTNKATPNPALKFGTCERKN